MNPLPPEGGSPLRPNNYGEWLGLIERDTMELRDALKARGVNVYSLNPFINIGLEGHSYSK